MSSFDFICNKCSKRICIQTEKNEQIKYCPLCGEKVITEEKKIESTATVENTQRQPIKIILPPRPKKNNGYGSTQTPREPKASQVPVQTVHDKKTNSATTSGTDNVKFCTEKNEYCCDGWIPEGYKPFARLETGGNPDVPLIVWAFAKNNSGKQMFNRFKQAYSLSKSKVNEENRFREYDEYLDSNAAAILKSNTLRLVKRFPISDREEEDLRNTLIKKREMYNVFYNNDFTKCVIQSLYAGKGGKLYEAEVGGEKKYVLLHTTILACEFGTYSPLNNRLQQRNDQLLNNIRNMASGRSSGYFMQESFTQQRNTQPQIDTDPNTPIGRHRTDGLTTAVISWEILNFSGFISPTMPTEREINDFFRFLSSSRVCVPLTNAIEQYQCQLVNQHIKNQQAITSSIQQATRSQQASFERSQAAIKSLSEYSSALTQQRIASDNARFDRSVRRNHEAIMGVNTYTRTDGMNVEVPVTADRVFQNNNDPNLLIGANLADDVPFGWTELQKLQ